MYDYKIPKTKTNLRLTVRPNDLDSIGHVNNAVALEYFETGRVDWMIKNQLDNGKSIVPVVSRCEIDYRQEIFAQEIEVITYIHEHGAYSVKFKQRIEVDSKIAAEALIQVGFIDAQQRKIVETQAFFDQEF